MSIVKCLIFDLDGTLLMTQKANFYAYRRAFQDVGVKLQKDRYDGLFGLRADEMIRKVAPQLSDSDVKKIKRNKSTYYHEYARLVKPNRILIDFMLTMKKKCKIALVTTASRANAVFILKHFGLKDAFDVSVFGEDVKYGKPNPECYLSCLKKCGVALNECLVFEDSPNGIKAALAAGLNVIEVSHD